MFCQQVLGSWTSCRKFCHSKNDFIIGKCSTNPTLITRFQHTMVTWIVETLHCVSVWEAQLLILLVWARLVIDCFPSKFAQLITRSAWCLKRGKKNHQCKKHCCYFTLLYTNCLDQAARPPCLTKNVGACFSSAYFQQPPASQHADNNTVMFLRLASEKNLNAWCVRINLR